ncbi:MULTISPECIES: M28 family peptidase [Citricoccus]|uniref:M28 family peptidase n=1 Tax=Citricoccus TaxID=169133 RepID=UPI000255F038|nr:M28 family peptidase [Citricoccus sp. CH26A]
MKLSWLLGPRPAPLQGFTPAVSRDGVPAAYEHLRQLQALANRHGDRAAGTSGYEAAARYVERQLADAGYRSTRQYFTFREDGREIGTFNILAETVSGRDDHVVMLGAHLDGVPGTAAINDNGSGVAAVLEAAKAVSRLDRIDHKVRFAWWGAEEFDKSHGSRHYVKDLAKNNPEELRKISSYLNFDMIASPNPVVAVYDARDSDPDFKIPDGSTQIMDLFTGYFDSRRQPWTTTDWGYDSDQVAFAKKGIAAGGLYTGDSDKKTKKEALIFGGEAKRPCDPHYHKPGDDLGNVNLGVLALMTDAIIHAATRLAAAPAILTKP